MIEKIELSKNGTYYHQIDVLSTLIELKSIFGEPENYFEKSYYNFCCEVITIDADGNTIKEPFTLYDYKEPFAPLDDEMFEWHIGTLEKNVAERVKLEIENKLSEIRNR